MMRTSPAVVGKDGSRAGRAPAANDIWPLPPSLTPPVEPRIRTPPAVEPSPTLVRPV